VTAAPDKNTLMHPEVEIQKTEQEVANLEGQLAAESNRLSEALRVAATRLQQLRAGASKLRLNTDEAPLSELVDRLNEARLPEPELSPKSREKTLELRRKAIEARRESAAALRSTIDRSLSELTQLLDGLNREEALLNQLQREAAERAAAEEIENARRASEKLSEMEKTHVRPNMPPAQDASDTLVRIPIGRMTPRSPRVRMQAVVDLLSDSNFFHGFSTNISEGGLFIATVELLPPGTEIDLHFSLPGGNKVEAKGVVRWTREVNGHNPDVFPGVGVQFTELPSDAATAIREFVSERDPIFFPEL
jgi:uncharacterized protein (TIGR02266 family)